MKKKCVIIVIAALFILATLVIALAIHISFYRNECPDDICQSDHCVKLSTLMFESVDQNISPCDNFYKFTCGKFVKEAEIPEFTGEFGSTTNAVDNVKMQLKMVLEEPIRDNDIKPSILTKKYYSECLNIESVEQQELKLIYDLMKNIGGWPVLENPSWNLKNVDWFYYLYKLRQLGLTADYFFKIDLIHDYKNTTFHILEVNQPTLSIPRNYFIDQNRENVLEEYQRFMINVAIYLGADVYRATSELADVLKFESNLAEIIELPINSTNVYNIRTVKDLEMEYVTIPWLEYFNNMIAPYAEITSSERILILSSSYITNLETLILSTSKRTQINYIVWKTIEHLIPFLNKDLRDLKFKFENALYGISKYKPRWEECVDNVYDKFSIVLSIQYVQMFPIDDLEERLLGIAHNIKMEFIASVEEATWIDKKLKKSTVLKLTNVKTIIGFTPDLLNNENFADAYNEAYVFPNEYARSFLNISLAIENNKYKRLRELKYKTSWMDENIGVKDKVLYNAVTNTIVIGPGVIQKNYFSILHPNYINYAGIGFEIARELSHTLFEDTQQFDDRGEFTKEKNNDEYTNKKNCLLKQYGTYQIEELDNKTFDSEATLENNVADNYGIKLAYNSYVKWTEKHEDEKLLPGLNYNQMQLFWISFGLNACLKMRTEYFNVAVETSIYAPNEFRIIGSLSNFDNFAVDFDCPSDSNMNVEKRCTL